MLKCLQCFLTCLFELPVYCFLCLTYLQVNAVKLVCLLPLFCSDNDDNTEGS